MPLNPNSDWFPRAKPSDYGMYRDEPLREVAGPAEGGRVPDGSSFKIDASRSTPEAPAESGRDLPLGQLQLDVEPTDLPAEAE